MITYPELIQIGIRIVNGKNFLWSKVGRLLPPLTFFALYICYAKGVYSPNILWKRQGGQAMETVKLASRRIHYIPINHIAPNPAQPRRHFDPQSLRELAESIRLHGILQPLTVQKGHYTYTLVAGERRLRAAGMAGLDTVPCVILNIDEESRAVLALIENLQRSGLHYLEEAEAIARLIATFGLSQEEAAAKLGKSQSAVANKLRLLRLSEPCAALLRQYQLTERHARALLRLTDEEQRLTALRHIGEQHLNVAQTEEYIETLLSEVQLMPPPRRPSYIIKVSIVPQQHPPQCGDHAAGRRGRLRLPGGGRGDHHGDGTDSQAGKESGGSRVSQAGGRRRRWRLRSCPHRGR